MRDIVIFGFGSQGRAQALNLRDRGCKVFVALPPESKGIKEANEAGFEVVTDASVAAGIARVAAILVPDTAQPALWKNSIGGNLKKHAAVIFAHGFNIHYKLIVPRDDLDVVLVAPMGSGPALRESFLTGKEFTFALAVHQDASGKAAATAEEYAKSIGCTKIIKTNFKEETETDLFSEQAVTCGGLMELVRAGMDTLVNAGYSPEMAYQCCLKETKDLASLLATYEIEGTLARISSIAKYGAVTRGPRVISKEVRGEMERILSEIKSGQFAREVMGQR